MTDNTLSQPTTENPQGPPTPSAVQETVNADTNYFHQLYHPRLPKWRPICALLAFLVVGGLTMTGVQLAALLIDQFAFGNPMSEATTKVTPAIMLGLNLGLASLWPVGVLVQRVFFTGYSGSLISVTGRIRPRMFLVSLAVTVPIWTVYTYLFTTLNPGKLAPLPLNTAIALGAVVILTTPLQAAAEEFAFRGLVGRVVGSFFASPRKAVVGGAVVSSIVFASAHFATDLWLIAYYFVFGLSLAMLAWRTRGLEMSIVVHAVNNVWLMVGALLVGMDTSTMFARSAGVGSAVMLIPIVLVPLACWLLATVARRFVPSISSV